MWEWWLQLFEESNRKIHLVPEFVSPKVQAITVALFYGAAIVGAVGVYIWNRYQARKLKQEKDSLVRQIGTALRLPEAPRPRPVQFQDVMAAVNQLADVVKTESTRSFWTGLMQNFFFFVLGTIASVIVPKLFP